MPSAICLQFKSTCRPFCNIGIRLILLSIHSKQDISKRTAKYHEVALMVNLVIINATWHTPQNRVNDTITHVTLITINGVVMLIIDTCAFIDVQDPHWEGPSITN